MAVRYDGLTLDWMGYATARIAPEDGPIVYTDPGRYGVLTGEWDEEYPHPRPGDVSPQDGDIVLVTHDHHYDDDGVRRVADSDATVLVYEAVDPDAIADHSGRDVAEPEDLPYDVQRVSYGDEVTIEGATIDVIPAYNHPDGRNASNGEPLHPEGFGCGFVVDVDGHRCFWTGDTDHVEAHDELDVSVFLPSISRSFTINREEAAELASVLEPELVLPIHYNTFDALSADSRAFAADVASAGIPVVLDES